MANEGVEKHAYSHLAGRVGLHQHPAIDLAMEPSPWRSTNPLTPSGSAHHWSRWFASRGHTAKLIAAEFVQPFRKSSVAKNDRNDAEAIAIASRQRATRLQHWIVEVYGRVGYHKTLVAIANKHARMLWAMLAKDEAYDTWQRRMIAAA